jgi:hypothetical protein
MIDGDPLEREIYVQCPLCKHRVFDSGLENQLQYVTPINIKLYYLAVRHVALLSLVANNSNEYRYLFYLVLRSS